jgi:hypothetical protein
MASGLNGMYGWASSTSAGVLSYGAQLTNTGGSSYYVAPQMFSVYSGGTSIDNNYPNAYQQYMVVYRASGYYVLGFDGLCSKPTLLWVDSTGSSNLYPGICNYNLPFSVSDVAVLDLTQFNDGITWTGNSLATSSTASPSSGATQAMTKDAMVEVTWTPASGETMELSFRYQDVNNRWICRCVQGSTSTIQIFTDIAGVLTQIGNTYNPTFNVGTSYRIVVICDYENVMDLVNGTKYHDFFNQATTPIPTFGITNTTAMVTVSSTGTLANFNCWPRYPAMSLSGWLPATANPAKLTLTGDSIPCGSGTTPPYIHSLMTPRPRYGNQGISGEQVVNGESPYATSMEADEGVGVVDTLYDSSAMVNYCIVWAGTNDCWCSPYQTYTAAHTALTAFCQNRRKAGYVVIVCTMLPRGLHTAGGWAANESWRNSYNTLITSNYQTYADGLADTSAYAVANWGTYPAENGTYILSDYTHPTSGVSGGAYALANSVIVPAINAYVGTRWGVVNHNGVPDPSGTCRFGVPGY